MAEDKVESVAFDPRAPQHRRKLWVRVQTSAGRRLVVFWPRVGALAVALLILAWLGLATTAWAFVRYQRGVAAVRWADVAFYPWRPSAYRATLGRHYLAVGKAQLDQERWNEGVSSLRAAVAYAPGLTEARRILADFYVAVKQPARARQILEDGLPQVRDDADYLERLFRLCGETNDWARIVRLAETRLPAAPDADPRHRQVALRAAQALGQLRRWDEAEAWLRRWGLEDGVDGQLLLADRDLARGEPEAARRRLEAALAANPANELLALQLTRWYRQAGRLADARLVTLLRTLAQPASPGARIDLLVLDHELGRHADFAQGVEAFLATHAGDGAALQLLARMAGELADPDLATRLLDLAGRAGHPLLVFRFGVLQAQCAAGRYADALATATEIDREPALAPRAAATLMACKCWAHYGSGDEAEGDVWLHRFVSGRELPAGDALGLAAALEKLGAPAAADKVLWAAVERAEAGSAPLVSLAALRVRRQDWLQAKALLPRLKAMAEPPAELIGTIESNVQLLGL